MYVAEISSLGHYPYLKCIAAQNIYYLYSHPYFTVPIGTCFYTYLSIITKIPIRTFGVIISMQTVQCHCYHYSNYDSVPFMEHCLTYIPPDG